MSWIHELSPLLPTPANLGRDVMACWADYREMGMPRRRRVAFCTLRVGQRIAYWAGWVAGGPAVRARTP